MIEEVVTILRGLAHLAVLVIAVLIVFDFLYETPRQLKRIADKLDNRDWKKGYEQGYADAFRDYGNIEKIGGDT